MHTDKIRAERRSAEKGEYYHIIVKEEKEFKQFRYHDVGKKGGLQRLAGQKTDGTWETQKWIIDKEMAHLEGESLIPDAPAIKELFQQEFVDFPQRIEGDLFQAKLKN